MPRRDASPRAEDLYLLDPKRKLLAVSYPGWMYVILTIVGIAAFATTGFLGYPTDPNAIYTFFHPAWALFLWFCVLIVIMQWSIFRHQHAASWRWQTLIVTFICIGLVAVLYTKPEILETALDWLARSLPLERGRILWNLANFTPILIYLADRAILWLKGERARYAGLLANHDITNRQQSGTGAGLPSMWELCSQDLFAGAALCFALAGIFQSTIVSLLTTQIAGVGVDECAVSWVIGNCDVGGAHNPPTLTQMDVVLAFSAIAASLLILGVLLIPRLFPQSSRAGVVEVARSVGDILRATLNPIDVFFRDLRNVLWPGLILAGIFGAATAARFTRLYLHILSDKQTCSGATTCPDLEEFALYLSNSLSTGYFQDRAVQLELVFLALAVLGGLVSVLTITFSAQILASKVRMRELLLPNWLWFSLRLVHRVLLVFWIISLGLSAFMAALLITLATTRAPFPQPGISTIVSFVYLCVIVVGYRRRSGRWPWSKPPAAVSSTLAIHRGESSQG